MIDILIIGRFSHLTKNGNSKYIVNVFKYNDDLQMFTEDRVYYKDIGRITKKGLSIYKNDITELKKMYQNSNLNVQVLLV